MLPFSWFGCWTSEIQFRKLLKSFPLCFGLDHPLLDSNGLTKCRVCLAVFNFIQLSNKSFPDPMGASSIATLGFFSFSHLYSQHSLNIKIYLLEEHF